MPMAPSRTWSITARACAIVLLLVSGTSFVTSFSPPSLHTQHYGSRKWTLTSLPSNQLDQSQSSTMESLKSTAKFLFPPIPEQEKEMMILHHFYPDFIINEFLLGFKYMCRVAFSLVIPSVLCFLLRHAFVIPDDSVMTLVDSTQPLHKISEAIKHSMLGWDAPKTFFITYFASAAIEESVFRGIGHFLCQSKWKAGLFLFASLCRWTIGPLQWELGAMYCISHFFLLFQLIAIKMRESQCFQSWFVIPIELVETLLWLGAVQEYPLWVRFSKTTETIKSGKANKSTESAAICHKSLQQKVLLAARINCAKQFGLAHCHVPGLVPSSLGLRTIQKCVGTFFSSLLVESRLATRRRNLWAPIGAHIAYNLVITRLIIVLRDAAVLCLSMTRLVLPQNWIY